MKEIGTFCMQFYITNEKCYDVKKENLYGSQIYSNKVC